MAHADTRLEQLRELPLTNEDKRYITHCLNEGRVEDAEPVLAAYASCWATAADGAPGRMRDNAGRRAANTFLREALGVDGPALAGKPITVGVHTPQQLGAQQLQHSSKTACGLW